jgi:hypothetical protein
MEAVPPPVPQSMPSKDDGHLNLLVIFHYVFAGLTFFFGSMPIIHVVFGLMMMNQTGPFGPTGVPGFQPQPTPDDVLFGREPGDPDLNSDSDVIVIEPDEFSQDKKQEELKTVGTIMAIGGAAIIGLAWLYAFLVVVAGRSLQKRKRHTYCIVMAGISCLSIPLGTVLGIFTIMVLQRPSVRVAFGKGD